MIDRILYQVSRRYWDCNHSKQSMFCNIGIFTLKDIVYGILFSTVLLNTDLNTVNIGAKSNKKMPLKTFLRNTWDLALNMAEKDSKINLEEFKKHQKKFESFLKVNFSKKDTYYSVRDHPIIQSQPNQKPVLARSSSSWSLNSSNVIGSMLSTLDRRPKGKSSQELLKSSGSLSDLLKKDAFSGTIVLEGVLIRKHLTESNGDKAKHRKWLKLWCAVRLHKENGAELVMRKVSNNSTEYTEIEAQGSEYYTDTHGMPLSSPNRSFDEIKKRVNISIGEKFDHIDYSPIKHPVLCSPSHDYKPSKEEPELFSLIHSFTTVYYYGNERNFCFSLILADNSVYLFEAPNLNSQIAWMDTINYWAARKSREPMRGGVGNVDFGWNSLERKYKSGDSSLEITRSKKLSKWTEATISTRLVSAKELDQQLLSMENQLEITKKEIETHALYKNPLEELVFHN